MTLPLYSAALLSALALTLAGVGALRLGWRQAGARRALVWGGWLMLLLATCAWIRAAGIEFGTSYSLLGLALAAWLTMALGVERSEPRLDRVATGNTVASSLSHKLCTFAAAGPLAAFACCQVTLLLVLELPITRVNQMAIAALLFPLLWGIAAYWSCYRQTPGRNALLFALGGSLSTGLLYL